MDIATLFVRFKADSSPVKQEMQELESTAVKRAGNIASTLAKAFGAAAVVAGIKKTIDAASDLQQAVGATETVFGSASKSVDAFAKSSAQSIGVSEASARNLTATMGALLKNLGFAGDQAADTSIQMAKLGADMAAAFGGRPEEAVEALTSALKGEFDPLERYGVSLKQSTINAEAMKQGLTDASGKVDAHGQAVAALSLILQQTADVQGQFAREADTAAGQQQRARAEAENTAASMGTNLLPIYTKVVEVVGDLAGVFGSLPAPVQTAFIALAGFVALSGPLGTVIELAGKLGPAISAAASAAGPTGLALVGLSVAVGLVVGALQGHETEAERAAKRAKEFYAAVQSGIGTLDLQKVALASAADAARDYSDAVYGDVDEKLRDAITGNKSYVAALQQLGLTLDDVIKVNRGGAEAQEALSDARQRALDLARQIVGTNDLESLSVSDVSIAYAQLGHDMDGVAEKGENQIGILDDLIKLLERQGQASYDSAQDAAELAKIGDDQAYVYLKTTGQLALLTAAEQKRAEAHLDATEAAKNDATATDDLGASLLGTAAASGAVSGALDTTTGRMDAASKAADDLDSALRKVLGVGLDLEEANRGLADGLDRVRDTVDRAKQANDANATSLDINTRAGRDNRTAIQAQVEAILDKIDADVQSGVAVDDATNAGLLYRQQLIDTAAQMGINADEAAAYIDQLGLTPDKIQTAVELSGVDSAEAKLTELARQRYADIVLRVTGGANVAGGYNPKAGAKSASGRYVPGGTNLSTTVAERPGRAGDEVILPLGDPSRIRQLLASNGVGSRIFDAVGDGRSEPDGVATSTSISTSSTTQTGPQQVGVFIDNYVADDTSRQSLAQMAAFILAGI